MWHGLDGWRTILGRNMLFLLPRKSRLALRPTQFPVKWITGDFPGIIQLRHETDLSLPSSAEVKNGAELFCLKLLCFFFCYCYNGSTGLFVGLWLLFQFLNPLHTQDCRPGDHPIARLSPAHRTAQME